MAPPPTSRRGKVVRSIQVNVVPGSDKSVHDSLTLLSYPLTARDLDSPLEMNGVRVKPENKMVEMSMGFPKDRDYDYTDPEKLERWKSSGSDGERMDHILFASTHIPAVCHYGVCGFPDGSRDILNLTPLKVSYQMRPSFAHIEKEDEEKQEKLELTRGGMLNPPQQGNNNNNSTEVDPNGLSKVQLKKKESERSMQARKSSYVYKRKMMDEEAWVELDIQPNKALNREGLDPVRDDDNQIAFDFDSSYMTNLCYLDELKMDKARENGISYTPVSNTSAEDVQSAISMVLSSFYTSHSPVNLYVLLAAVRYKSRDDVLEALKVCGDLIRGNFVLKSKLTQYGPNAQAVRDTILDILMDVGVVHRERLKRAVQVLDISKDLTDHMLMDICKQNDEGWVLKLEDDALFYADYSDLAKDMDEEWKINRERVQMYRERYDNDVLAFEGVSL